MFSAEPWARAFTGAFPLPDGQTGDSRQTAALEESLDILRAYCRAALSVPGKLSGLNGAERIAPLISAALAKAGLAASSGEAGADNRKTAAAYARNFFLLMVQKGRFQQYQAIVNLIQKLINKKKGRVEVILEAPFEGDPAFLESVRQSLLQKIPAREITVKPRLVPGLVGGIRLLAGGVLFDGSLRARMEQMTADLSAAGEK
jgi:F0F1-type ATP synthase delta subunit